MQETMLSKKQTRLFIILAGIFITNALVAELIGGKVFSLEETLGYEPLNIEILGTKVSLQFSAGTILWPIVFVLTDVINEYYGERGVRLLSNLTVGLIGYSFLMIYLAMGLAPADFWVISKVASGIENLDMAYNAVLGQGLLIIIGSMIAFMVGQIIDVLIFHRIKKMTGDNLVWLRATGSTIISQGIDSFIVLYIAFVGGPALTGFGEPWPMSLFWAVGFVGYFYKIILAVVMTPAIYLAHYLIDQFLGEELSNDLKIKAMNS